MLSTFQAYNKTDILSVTHVRKFETKLGEIIPKRFQPSHRQNQPHIFSLNNLEDIGVKANNGIGGADSCWSHFPIHLNIQQWF